MNDHKKRNNYKRNKNWFEWVVFGVSLTLVVAILGYLVYKIATHKISPPHIQVEYYADPNEEAPYRYRLLVYNNGGQTAEEVIIELILTKGDSAMEKAEIQIPFVPQSSMREGWINFSDDPLSADSIQARVVSFKKP